MDECNVLRLKFEINDKNNNVFSIQQKYFTKYEQTIYNECVWLASRAHEIFPQCEILKIGKLMPVTVIYKHNKKPFVLIKEYKLQRLQLLKLIDEIGDYSYGDCIFNEVSFKFFHKNIIENYCKDKIDVAQFYCEYGYWNNLEIEIVNPFKLIASNELLLKNTSIDNLKDVKTAMKDFFNNKCSYNYNFNPYVYIASDYEELKQFVNCIGNINEDRVIKHYIRNPNKKIIQFDIWEYLANNIKRLPELMIKSESGKILWDIHRVTPENVAKIFVKHKGKCNHGVFKDCEFVKAYVDDFEFVNTDRKLSLENAPEYFVKTYVKYEEIRHKFTLWYRFLVFLQARIFDSVKQVPFNATRFLIESKCI